MDFNKYAKHRRLWAQTGVSYQQKEVEKSFNEALSILGEPDCTDDAVFITCRLKGKSDWITAHSAVFALEWKLCKHFWKKKGKKMLISGTAPFVSCIEHNEQRIKDHIHAVLRLKDLKKFYTRLQIEKDIYTIARSLDEVNSNVPDSVRVRIFPFCDKTEEQAREVGNTIEYICKTSSKHCKPLLRDRTLLSRTKRLL